MVKIVVTSSHGKEDPERAYIPFAVAKEVLQFDQEVQISIHESSVNSLRVSYDESPVFHPFPPIKRLIDDLLNQDGKTFYVGFV